MALTAGQKVSTRGFFLSEKLGKLTAPLIGALPEETIVTGSTTTNIHQVIATFYEPKGIRTKNTCG